MYFRAYCVSMYIDQERPKAPPVLLFAYQDSMFCHALPTQYLYRLYLKLMQTYLIRKRGI